MEIKYFGHSCFYLKGKEIKVLLDPFDPVMVGLPLKNVEADLVTISHQHRDHNFSRAAEGRPYIIAGPGEYEVKGVGVTGIQSSHDESEGKERGSNTVYLFEFEGVNLCHLGDLGRKLLETELKDIGGVDVLFVPVGGVFTIDAETAVEVISQIEPKMVVPMHYKMPGMKPAFEELSPVEDFIRELGEVPRYEKTLKIGRETSSPEKTVLVVLGLS